MDAMIIRHVETQIELYENLIKSHLTDSERSNKRAEEARDNLSKWKQALEALKGDVAK